MQSQIDSSTITKVLRRRTIASYYCSQPTQNYPAPIVRETRFSSGSTTGYLEKYMISSSCIGRNGVRSDSIAPVVPPQPPYPVSYAIFDGLGVGNSGVQITLNNTPPTEITYDGGGAS